MSYVVIFDFVLKTIAYLVGIGFCIYVIIYEIKTYKMNKKFIKELREIEKSFKNEDNTIKSFVSAYIDAMEE